MAVEEAQCWSQAVESLDEFLGLRNDKAAREAPLALNRLIADLPEDNARLPEALNPIRQNLSGSLEGMKDQADKELKYALFIYLRLSRRRASLPL